MEGGSRKVSVPILTMLYLNDHMRDLAEVSGRHARLCAYMKYPPLS